MGTLLAYSLDQTEQVEVFIKNPLVTPRRITDQEIVCGDCAGEAALPRATFLASDHTCASCGGRSYVLASKLQLSGKGKEPNDCEIKS